MIKTEGVFHVRLREWVNKTIIFFMSAYVFTTLTTLIYMPHMMDRIREFPWLIIIPLLSLLSILNIPLQLRKGNDGWAVISSLSIFNWNIPNHGPL